jgi:uncharacterized membrane protein
VGHATFNSKGLKGEENKYFQSEYMGWILMICGVIVLIAVILVLYFLCQQYKGHYRH